MGRPALDDLDRRVGPVDDGAVVVPPTGQADEVVDGVGGVLRVEFDHHLAEIGVEHRGVGPRRIDAHREGTGEVDLRRRGAVGGRALGVGRRLGVERVGRGRHRGCGRGRHGGRGCRRRRGLRSVVVVGQPDDHGHEGHAEPRQPAEGHQAPPASGPAECFLCGGHPASPVGLLSCALVVRHGARGYRPVSPSRSRTPR